MQKYWIAALAAALLGSPALAAGTVVKVSLWDKGPESLDKMGTGPGMGMGMPAAGAAKEMVGIKADRATVPAGEVTFEVVNQSKDMVHEMVVAPAEPPKPLPYDKADQEIKEDAASPIGEVSELDPGASGSVELNLKPGRYVLFCNVPGHYMLGMWTELTVTG